MVERLNRISIFEKEELESSLKETTAMSFKLIRRYKQELDGIHNTDPLYRMRTKRRLESSLSHEIASIAYQNFSNLPQCEKGYIDFIWSLNAKRGKIGKGLTKQIIKESIDRIDAHKTALKKLLRSEAKRKIYREEEDEEFLD
ncbi:hypothetical protein M1439_04075 [Candidatus Marsarchaeota archaeon]|jgi:hypothetical protein|nr:hypothetical protein [Candidatus Marsarchaeota archaeon]MCL5092760.1 hypothetical protein [Candidatus Marsarchaeota archaeon]